MVAVSILATALNSGAAHPFGIFVNGLDIVAAVPLESVHIVEAGATGNGSMECEVWDPTKAYSFTGGEVIQMWDFGEDEPLFTGYIDSTAQSPAFATGRIWQLRCVDLNVILDRTAVPDETLPANTAKRWEWVQQLIGEYTALRHGHATNSENGTQANPVGSTGGTVDVALPLISNTIVIEGQTLRGAIEQIGAGSYTELGHFDYQTPLFFVDSYWGFHYYYASIGSAPYAIDPGSVKFVNAMTYELDVSQVINAVYIDGANANGSGWVRDSESIGLYGERQRVIPQPDSDTTTKRDSYGQDFLDHNSAALIRGSYTVTGVGYEGLHAGQAQVISNANLGISNLNIDIQAVETTFLTGTGKRQWVVRWGGALPMSIARLIRRALN